MLFCYNIAEATEKNSQQRATAKQIYPLVEVRAKKNE